MTARYIGWGFVPREHLPLRCGCKGPLLAFGQVGGLIVGECWRCGATWDMSVLRIGFEDVR